MFQTSFQIDRYVYVCHTLGSIISILKNTPIEKRKLQEQNKLKIQHLTTKKVIFSYLGWFLVRENYLSTLRAYSTAKSAGASNVINDIVGLGCWWPFLRSKHRGCIAKMMVISTSSYSACLGCVSHGIDLLLAESILQFSSHSFKVEMYVYIIIESYMVWWCQSQELINLLA